VAQLFSLGSIEHLIKTTPQNYENHTSDYSTLDTVCILRVPFIHLTSRRYEPQPQLVGDFISMFFADVLFLCRGCDIQLAARGSRVAEAVGRFGAEEVELRYDAA
jgi:hypothetical protein